MITLVLLDGIGENREISKEIDASIDHFLRNEVFRVTLQFDFRRHLRLINGNRSGKYRQFVAVAFTQTFHSCLNADGSLTDGTDRWKRVSIDQMLQELFVGLRRIGA